MRFGRRMFLFFIESACRHTFSIRNGPPSGNIVGTTVHLLVLPFRGVDAG